MKHLKYLKIIHFLVAALYLFIAVCMLGTGIFFIVGSPMEDSAMAGGGLMGASVVVAIIAMFYFNLGGKLAQGRGRVGATVLSVMNMGNCPGIFVSAYVLYICWFNAETKKFFEDPLSYDFE